MSDPKRPDVKGKRGRNIIFIKNKGGKERRKKQTVQKATPVIKGKECTAKNKVENGDLNRDGGKETGARLPVVLRKIGGGG